MNYFKNTNNEIFAYDDEQVAQGYGKDLTSITRIEADSIINPPKTALELVEEQRSVLKQTRDTALQNNTYTIDTAVYQVRPQDLANYSQAISDGVSVDWVLADNSVRLTTVAELQEILSGGVAQGKVIWTTYTDALKGL